MRQTKTEDEEPVNACSALVVQRHYFVAELVTETAMLWMDDTKASTTIKCPPAANVPGNDEAKTCLQFQLDEVDSEPVIDSLVHFKGGTEEAEPEDRECTEEKPLHRVTGLQHVANESTSSSGNVLRTEIQAAVGEATVSNELPDEHA